MNKRGFLRIVEASVSIVIIVGVLFLFFTNAQTPTEPDLSEMARDILEEVSKNTNLREDILNGVDENVVDFVDARVPSYLNSEVVICEIGDACGKSEYVAGDIYSAERSISSTLNNLDPKKVRLFIWEG